MTQSEFMQQLAAALADLPAAEREEILADYRAYFIDGLADGRSEADITAALGEPQRLANELAAEYRLRQWESHKTPSNLKHALTAMAGLGVINLVLALPYLLVLTVLSSLWLGAVSVLLVGMLITGSWVTHSVFGWPVYSGWVVNDSGIGPVLIHTGGSHQPPRLQITTDKGESVKILPDASSGKLTIEARDGEEYFQMERDANGQLSTLKIGDGNSTIDLSGVKPLSSGGVLVFGVVLLLLGTLGTIFGWKALKGFWQGTGAWLRWQRQLMGGDTLKTWRKD